MIDLRNKSLPDTITVNGKDFLIKTDFRLWLKFSTMIEEERPLSDYLFLLEDGEGNIPLTNFFPQLVQFYTNPNPTPKNISSTSTDRIVDYIEDGEYIVASFMQDYGIDLTTCDMHWHRFKALFVGLSDNTKIKQIMSMRAYKKNKKSYDAQCEENKKAWALSQHTRQVSADTMNEINELFYNSVYQGTEHK
jgi:hypothetical protein